ncbi:MAG: ABC transporter permease [Bacteroidales bacterium]|nr:ABC transporter permease [Bacteroidales bacterium]
MFKSYIKTAFRGITKSKFHATLNILGLGIGFAAFIFIFMYVSDELAYDKYNGKADRIFRIESDFNISGNHDQFAIVPIPMAPALALEFPEIESFCRFNDVGNSLFRYGEKEFYEEHFYFVDSTVFDIFSYKLLAGNPTSCLTEPFSIVISQSVSNKYFGEKNPMGEIIESGTGRKYKVTGIIEDVPRNSHLWFDAMLSSSSLSSIIGEERFNNMEPGAFWNIGVYSFLLISENASMQNIHDKFGGFYDKYMKPVGDALNASFNLISTPLTQTHFSGNLSADLPKGSMAYIYIFGAIAVFILLIAAINYMNMATARSVKRSREVGIRKVSGALRHQLIGQFLTESLLLAIVGLLISVLLVYFLLPDFNTLSGKTMDIGVLLSPRFLVTIIGTTLFIGLISGSYPAFYLSSFKPVTVIKGTNTGRGKTGGMLRRVLVVFQFAIAISMIIATVVVSNQLNFLKNKDMGFQKKNMVVLELQDTTFRSKAETFKQELLQNPNILSAANSTGIPGQNSWIQVVRIEKDTAMIDETMIITVIDYDYLNTYGIEILQGRNFDKKMGTDAEEAVIVNQTAVEQYGWSSNPIGKKIHWGFELDGSGGRILKVVGVAKDFHFNSLHNKVEPIMMFLADFNKRFITLRVNPENFGTTMQYVEEKWNQMGAKRPFDYQLLEDTWGKMYQAEQTLGLIIAIATFLTIFIALLGLLGLSSFIAEQKTKEIGIRKVLGASVGSVLGLLYKEFIMLIVIAYIVAIPLSVWQLNNWLESGFVYHTNISVVSVLLAGLIAIVISLLTISFHTLKAVTGNPVDAIKYE